MRIKYVELTIKVATLFVSNNYSFLDKFNVTEGVCLNENGDYNDIFHSDGTKYTLNECKDKCENTIGCGAVTYADGSCYGTSMKATTVGIGSNWKCYYIRRNNHSIYI